MPAPTRVLLESTMPPTLSPEQIEGVAQRRAARKMGWYIHALVFVMVNTGLAILSAFTGRRFALVSAFVWGLGLLIHGVVVFFAPAGSGFRERLVQRERDRLQREQDQP